MAVDQCGVVQVKTTARAHLGFMDPSGRGVRPFGSIGLTLDKPCTDVRICRASRLNVAGCEAERAERYLREVADYFGAGLDVELVLTDAIPAHAGLGSGTQLAIAIGTAYTKLYGIDSSPREIATVLGRGKRSGIGIGSFANGGFLFDAGPSSSGSIAPIISRIPFPGRWRVVLVFDRTETALHGEQESRAFDGLPDFKEADVAELCRRTVMGIVPALAEADFSAFCRDVAFVQEAMGQYFQPVQGGHYTSTRVGEVIRWAKERGFSGVGQSSWGPTGVVFAASESDANALIAAAKEKWSEQSGLEFLLSTGRNRGAEVLTPVSLQRDINGEIEQPV